MITRSGRNWQGRFDAARLRYHKIIIMTDRRGRPHIRTLLLTFFVTCGADSARACLHAQPPLYRIKKGKSEK
jgi:DNA gyrase subunit B